MEVFTQAQKKWSNAHPHVPITGFSSYQSCPGFFTCTQPPISLIT